MIGDEHFYLLRSADDLSSENDVWTALDDISRDLDPFIQEYHRIHWQDSRPAWEVFISPRRLLMGLSAKRF